MSRKSTHRSKQRSDHQRIQVAQEAARLIHENGITDFKLAKSKAAENLGLLHHGALPSNHEIADAVAEHGRIFFAEEQDWRLNFQRETALYLMRKLQSFKPRLVGSVLSGQVTEHSPIELHLYSDTSETVAMWLDAHGVPYQTATRRHNIQKNKPEVFPAYHFVEEDCLVQTTVFPMRRPHAPLCPVNGKPMDRAGIRDVEQMLEPEPFEAPAPAYY